MANKTVDDSTYMGMALLNAKRSKAVRKKVGAILVTRNGVILAGYNGTPSGEDNCCETVVDGQLVTKPNVLHAELNCILKAAKEGVSCVGSTLYVTLSPCVPCAAMIKEVGIVRVVYLEQYRDMAGNIELLSGNKLSLEQLENYANS